MHRARTRIALVALAFFAIAAPYAASQGTADPGAGGQGTAAQENVPAVFPSHLRATVKDERINLAWTDSPDVKSGYAIYRSIARIDAESFPQAFKVASVTSGAQVFSDAPPDGQQYYYAVLCLSEDGTPYKVFIPGRSVTTTGVAALIAAPVAESSAPFVASLAARVKGESIIVSYSAKPGSRLVLYRGGSPIKAAGDLLDATLVAAFTDKDGSFVDYPVPGVDYFYAMLGEDDLRAGRIALASGVNSLATPVQVAASTVSSGLASQPASRTPPLPSILLEGGMGGPEPTLEGGPPPYRAVSPEAAKAIETLLAKAPALMPRMPTLDVLPEDRVAPTGGEDYALSIIVGEKIGKKDWAGATEQLRKYLSLNRAPKTAARAHFYLGEALANTGAPRDAFFEFLSARDHYPVESKPWIEYVLASLRGS
jgi:hypothetical protein